MDSTLKKAVENLHNCLASFVQEVTVKEKFGKEIVWNGTVSIFNLKDHPEATRCYAWSHGLDDSSKRKFIAVLHQGPIDSPQAAVRAAIASEYHKQS